MAISSYTPSRVNVSTNLYKARIVFILVDEQFVCHFVFTIGGVVVPGLQTPGDSLDVIRAPTVSHTWQHSRVDDTCRMM